MMELARKVAQLLIVGVPGTQLKAEDKKCLQDLGPGGVILFKRNYENLKQIIALNNEIQASIIPYSFRGMPAWLSVDHEGGRVQRFGDPFTKIPPARTWGEVNSPKSVFEL